MLIVVTVVLVLSFGSSKVLADNALNSIVGNTPFFDPDSLGTTSSPTPTPCTGSSGAYGGTFDQWLQAVAEVESGDNPTANNGSATGIYQWEPETWLSNRTVYGPALQYNSADEAPADVQFAVAYLNYGEALKSIEGQANLLVFNNNPFFWLSVEHYIPAALTDFSLPMLFHQTTLNPQLNTQT